MPILHLAGISFQPCALLKKTIQPPVLCSEGKTDKCVVEKFNFSDYFVHSRFPSLWSTMSNSPYLERYLRIKKVDHLSTVIGVIAEGFFSEYFSLEACPLNGFFLQNNEMDRFFYEWDVKFKKRHILLFLDLSLIEIDRGCRGKVENQSHSPIYQHLGKGLIAGVVLTACPRHKVDREHCSR